MKTLHHIRALALCFTLLTATGLHAQVPQLVNYQGRVAVGTVNFDGSGQFKFALVNANGSTTYWSNDGTSTAGSQPTAAVALTVTKGLYSVMLGDPSLMTAIPATPANQNPFLNADVRLRVWFSDGTANGFQLLTPDQRLAPNGYLPDDSVTSAALAANSIVPGKIAANAVTTGKIAANAVTAAKLANGAVGSAQIAAGTVIPTQTVSGASQAAVANTSYTATGATPTDFILPATANVGDSVQITASGGGWTYTGVWVPRESARNWRSVASSADGSKLVAVVDGGQFGGQIYTSTNSGENWTARESNRFWFSVASSADGSKLVAAAADGKIYTSANSGENWTARESDRFWNSVASSADGTKLVAVVGGAGGQIYTSTNSGENWTPRENSRVWISVASSADGSKLVAVEYGGRIYTSANSGVNWTPQESNRPWLSVASSADGSKLVAGTGGQQIYTSTDSGGSWTARESNGYWGAVASSTDGGKLVAANYAGQIYTTLSGAQGSQVTLQHLGNGQWAPVAQSQVAAGAVGGAQIAAGAVGSSHIGFNAVASNQLAANSVSAAKIDGTSVGLWSVNGGDIYRNSAVGIGTTTLPARLSVTGAGYGLPATTGTTQSAGLVVRLRDSTNLVLDMGGNESGGFWLQSTDASALSTNYNLNLNPNGGNVGIGTSTPGELLSLLAYGTARLSLAPVYGGRRWIMQSVSAFTPGDAPGGSFQLVDTTDSLVRLTVLDNGNVGIGTTSPTTKLDVAGEVTCVALNITSDRHAKEQFKPVNAREVLDKVARLPITEWQYKTQDDQATGVARHIGPMAQDFREAFALGRDEKHITSVDADGVALAAIQGLNEKLEQQVKERDAELDRMKAENRSLAERLDVIERALRLREQDGKSAR